MATSFKTAGSLPTTSLGKGVLSRCEFADVEERGRPARISHREKYMRSGWGFEHMRYIASLTGGLPATATMPELATVRGFFLRHVGQSMMHTRTL